MAGVPHVLAKVKYGKRQSASEARAAVTGGLRSDHTSAGRDSRSHGGAHEERGPAGVEEALNGGKVGTRSPLPPVSATEPAPRAERHIGKCRPGPRRERRPEETRGSSEQWRGHSGGDGRGLLEARAQELKLRGARADLIPVHQQEEPSPPCSSVYLPTHKHLSLGHPSTGKLFGSGA